MSRPRSNSLLLEPSYRLAGSSLQGRKLRTARTQASLNSAHGDDDPFAPLILMSGFVVKRTRRGFGANKWQKRYWQLLGDGALIYFSGDHRLKVLGEIDIAHTCYEVRHGSENCEIKFPPAVPPSCCFSVAVLKRTYYFYAFSKEEAEKWVEALTSTSYLINRLRPRSLNCNPAVQVAMKALNETSTAPLPPSTLPPPSSYHKPPPPPPPTNTEEQTESESFSEGNEDFDAPPSELPNFSKLSHGGRRNMSVPDLRFDSSSITHNGSWIDGSPRIRSSSISTATPSPLTSTFTDQNMNRQPGGVQRRKKRVAYNPEISAIENPHTSYQKPRVPSNLRQRYMSQGNLFEENGMDYTHTTTLPSPTKLAKMKQKWKSAYDVQWSPAFERLEELQQQENAIRKRIEEMKKFESFSYLSQRGVPVYPPTSPATERESSLSLSQPFQETPEEVIPSSPGYFSQPTTTSDFPVSSASRKPSSRTEIKSHAKKGPPKVSPKPVGGRRPTPATSFAFNVSPAQKSGNEIRVQHSILEDPQENNVALLERIDESPKHDAATENSESKGLVSNIWVKQELTKLIGEIRKIGYKTPKGQLEVKFGLLLDQTEGLFEALLGTLLTARKHKVIHFEGEILLKGVNDDTPITLLKNEV